METCKMFKSYINTFNETETEGTFTGYASTYGNTDRDDDIIETDAFKTYLDKRKTYPLLFNHNRDIIIGKIEVSNSDKGLEVTGTLNLKDSKAQNIYDLLKMGALDSMSVGFRIHDYSPVDEKSPWGGWKIKEAELYEVSVVTIPANPEALVEDVKADKKKTHEKAMKEIDQMLAYYETNLKGEY